MARVYKIIVSHIDFDNKAEEDIIGTIENQSEISLSVEDVELVDIGEWRDDHPLNKRSTHEDEFNRLFQKKD